MKTLIQPALNPHLKNPAAGHLVLTRRVGECITIGEDAGIVIRVMDIHHKGTIQLAIEAPKELPIWREELYQKIKAEGYQKMPSVRKSNVRGLR